LDFGFGMSWAQVGVSLSLVHCPIDGNGCAV
jgi:hypothetical protein